MAGFENNPRTMYLGADMPFFLLGAYHGAGVSLINDQIGLFTHQRIALQYAYKHKLFGGNISVGAQFGFLNEQFDGSKVDLGESNDPAFATSDVKGNAMADGMPESRRSTSLLHSWSSVRPTSCR